MYVMLEERFPRRLADPQPEAVPVSASEVPAL
jgi:hypothetical protein